MRPRSRNLTALAVVVTLVAAACGSGDAPELDPALGGETTRVEVSRNSFGLAAPGLSNEERREFEVGDSFFTQNWVAAPVSTEARDGLGPTFNAMACSSCHTLDGRGVPPDGRDDTDALGLLVRLSVLGPDGHPVDEPTYGDQLQDRANLGIPPEGRLRVDWVTEEGEYDDGTAYELRRPEIEITDLAFGPLADDVLISPRLAPQVIGVGLLEAVPEATIRDAADPEDDDGDGISGRPNEVIDPRTGENVLGRFGWKANVATVEAQVAGAFRGDIGITSSLASEENCRQGMHACAAAPTGGHPEIDDDTLGRVTFYNRTLAVPAMRDHTDDDVRAGAQRFEDLGCAACHTTTLETGDSDVDVLADQTIHPYTDLLLHDMGPGLAEDRPDGLATGVEWRTPPLWGLGLIETVSGARFLLHDGRARSVAEAILWHGGEAERSMRGFRALDADERAELLAFLEAL